MKILFCNKYDVPFSGTEVYLFEVMEMLRSRGHEVALFSMNGHSDSSRPYRENLAPAVDFKDTSHGVWKRAALAGHAIYSFETRSQLRRFIRDFRPDIAHVRNIYHHLSPSLLWELRHQHIPVLYHLNDFKMICPSYNLVAHGQPCDRCRRGQFHHVLTTGCYNGPAGASLVLAAEAYVHRWLQTYRKCVTRFLAPSHFAREKLIQNGWDGALIDVLYHPQAVPAEPPPPATGDAPVLYFGRLSPEKGVSDLLRAALHLREIRFQIAGDGPQRADLEDLALQLGLQNVEFLGQLSGPALRERIAASRLTVFPSLAYETFGKSILESFAQARPVVATDLGSRRELIRQGETGLLYNPGDIEGLATAIRTLFRRPELLETMGHAGYQLARERHSPTLHCDALLRLYQQLKDSGPAIVIPARQYQRDKLRVAFIGGRGVGSKYSGIETWYEEVGERLASAGHDVTAYCRSYFTPGQTTYRGIRVLRSPTVRTKHLETFVHTALSAIHASFCPYDIVHFHALGPSLFSFLPRLTGRKTIVSVQGLDWQRKKWGKLAVAVLRLGERTAALFPNSTIVVSRTLQRYYRDRYSAVTTYIPNGTDLLGRLSIRCLHNWNLAPQRYVLFLGRFSPEKNCDLLIRAFHGIDTDVKLVLAGGSSYSDRYAQELRREAGKNVLLLDWISGEALEELITNAMLFVLPSDMEGLSLALLDAMAAGLCVLASDVPENRELVDGAGFTFRRCDQEDLQNKLRMLIGDASLRETAGRAASKRIRETYLWPEIARQVEQEYRRVLGLEDEALPYTASTGQNAA